MSPLARPWETCDIMYQPNSKGTVSPTVKCELSSSSEKAIGIEKLPAASFPGEDLRQLGGFGIEQASLRATKEMEKGVKGLER